MAPQANSSIGYPTVSQTLPGIGYPTVSQTLQGIGYPSEPTSPVVE